MFDFRNVLKESFKVVVGVSNLSQQEAENYYVKEIILKSDDESGLAALKLFKPVKQSAKVGLVNLPTETMLDQGGKAGFVFSWTNTETTRNVSMEILTNLVCQFFFTQINQTVSRDKLCGLTEETDGQNPPSCIGDMGSE